MLMIIKSVENFVFPRQAGMFLFYFMLGYVLKKYS